MEAIVLNFFFINRYHKTNNVYTCWNGYDFFFMIDIKSVPFLVCNIWIVSTHIVICSFSPTLVQVNVRQYKSTRSLLRLQVNNTLKPHITNTHTLLTSYFIILTRFSRATVFILYSIFILFFYHHHHHHYHRRLFEHFLSRVFLCALCLSLSLSLLLGFLFCPPYVVFPFIRLAYFCGGFSSNKLIRFSFLCCCCFLLVLLGIKRNQKFKLN